MAIARGGGGAYGRLGFGRAALPRAPDVPLVTVVANSIARVETGSGVAANCFLPVEIVSSSTTVVADGYPRFEIATGVIVDLSLPLEASAGIAKDTVAAVEIRGSGVSRLGAGGAWGRSGFGRTASVRSPLAAVSTNSTPLTTNLALCSESLGAQLRSAGVGTGYPAVNYQTSLARGMVGAYFPGYGAPVKDATGTWIPLTTQSYASAGTLVNMPGFGPGMEFDGLYNGLWATRSDMPVAPAQGVTAITMAMVVNVIGPTNDYGAGFCICSSSNGGERQHLGWFLEGDPTGSGQFVTNGASTATLLDPTVRTMPTGLSVLVATLAASTVTPGTSYFYVNGTQVASVLTEGFTTLDTISMGCRAQANANLYQSGFAVTSGSPTMVGGTPDVEDTVLGTPVTDTLGYIPTGTIVIAYDGNVTYTLSKPATGTNSNDSVIFGGPETRLKNAQIGLGVLWNRILTPAEIASFSGNPLGAFFMPITGDPLVEISAGLIEDTSIQAESLAPGATLTDNSYAPIENLAGQRSEGSLPAEWLHGALSDTVSRVEVLADQKLDTTAPAEELAGQKNDAALPVEEVTGQRTDSELPTESTGATATIRDQFLPIEALAGSRSDASLKIESRAIQRADANTPDEGLASQRFDTQTWVEALGTALRDRGMPAEWLGALGVITDALQRIEILTGQRNDAGTPFESVASLLAPVISDNSALLEILSGVRGDLRAIVEVLQSTRADGSLATEILEQATAVSELPSEIIGQATAILNGLFGLEGCSQLGADALLGCDAILSYVADATVAGELWSTPPPLLGIGRVLRSSGRRRLLSG